MRSDTPQLRLLPKNEESVREDGDYVLYWMIAARRTRWNFALDRAVEWSNELGKPLLVLEALRCDYRWASDRFHRFVIEGMRDNAAALADSGIGYLPFVETQQGEGKGLLEALAAQASVVVTDEFPSFFLPTMVNAAASKLDLKVEAVDSNGLLPLAAADRPFTRAYDFRRFLQRELGEHLADGPHEDVRVKSNLAPFESLPERVERGWPGAAIEELLDGSALNRLPIDHGVGALEQQGGSRAASAALKLFLEERLNRYGEERNEPGSRVTSELSGYLHFGHLSPHEILAAVADREEWTPWQLGDETSGARRGWWNLGESIEGFLDQVVTWRELGYNRCFHTSDFAEYDSLPDWARTTLREHEGDARPYLYGLDEFESARTHDEIWNAAQRELVETGRIHNYLRMLWGKKILHWSRSPREALDTMIELNNKYAVDGRNPNSYSGIFWVLGRFDRAWGPEREVFGKVRYMSSRNTRRKLRLEPYLDRWGDQRSLS